ncbi:MAG: sugar ABC transporter ATP-binding protein [Rhodospirillaceae bacterium]|nr:sugar ABC transporter ATP-binding protein [Rhodospirillaceae bacterium]
MNPQAEQQTSYALERVTRLFPGVRAVDDVSMAVRAGEIHGVIGRNGAGKSVLVSMIAGLIPPTAGRILIGDQAITPANATPAYAHDLGVSLIPQEPKFAPNLSVIDNVFMGRQPTNRLGMVQRRRMAEEVDALLAEFQLNIDPRSRVRDLSVENQQLLAFGKALRIEQARVVLLDEITASLTRERRQMLLELLKRFAHEIDGISFTLISHRIAEVMEFCDRVTVMRDGKAVATLNTTESSAEELAAWIVGDSEGVTVQAMAAEGPSLAKRSAEPLMTVEGLALEGAFSGLDLDLRVGEVVGFAGLEGSGKDAALETLFGLQPATAGTIAMDGEEIRLTTPRQALDRGIALLPKHREAQAVVQNRSVEENTLLASYRRFANSLGLINGRRASAAAAEATRALKVKTPSLGTMIDHLSGGNKQKVMVNRLAMTTPKVVLLNEPTRGVDLSVKPDLLRVVRTQMATEAAVVMISESEDELIAICDRIFIFFKGRVVRVLQRGAPDFTVGDVFREIQGVSSL